MQATSAPTPQTGIGLYGGLFFTTLSTLMYEILLTRIFSVTMWYHFAFMAVSVALFGMTVGALIVHLAPERFSDQQTRERLAQAALLFTLTLVLSFVVQLQIPFEPEWSFISILLVATTYLVISVPFIFSGIVVCLTLTRFPAQVSRLYAADLIGAGLGTITLIWLLNLLNDGPSTVLAIAALASLGAALFGWNSGKQRYAVAAYVGAALLVALALSNATLAQDQNAVLKIRYVKGGNDQPALTETWNAFSRVSVLGDPEHATYPFGWGLSPACAGGPLVRQLFLVIDSTAGTPLTYYDGSKTGLAHLRCDVTNMAHYIRSNGDVFIIGAGGGRDVLTSLYFKQHSITAVELNGDILNLVNGKYGDFTGHLDKQPGVRFVNDEARSYLARSDERYDLIQISLIDTWAATAAGAFALSENSLYTVEAWETYLDHLKPGGVLSVSRWYYGNRPMEAYRLTSLASTTLRRMGVERPRDHLIFIKGVENELVGTGVGTILVGREPFSAEDVSKITLTATAFQFEMALTPTSVGSDPVFAQIAEAEDPGSISLGFPADISAPTDNRPFFFQMFHVWDMFNPSLYDNVDPILTKPFVVLFSLVVTVLALTTFFILLPLALTTSRQALKGMTPFVVFFCAIGMGFLLLEVAQLQRLIIFLGHPTYALSVLLFSLLIFSGLGSLATERLLNAGSTARLHVRHLWPLGALLVVLLAFGLLTPATTHTFDAETTPVRIMFAVLILAPMGLFMGMPFPLGMKVASRYENAPTAFFWGVNGATSVCASVLAVAISLGWGISNAFWVGCFCYAIAAIALGAVTLRGRTT
ncbi:MAG: hypothetical protein WBD55_05860 [Dehalococcoidia bacterium]